MEQVKGSKLLFEGSKKTISLMIKDHRNLKHMALTASAATAFSIACEPYTLLLLMIIYTHNLIKLLQISKERSEEINTLRKLQFRNTQTYKECKEEYDKVIKKTASLIRRLGLNSSKEICVFIGELINQGYLSETGKNQFKSHIFDKERYLPELAGAKVLTGKCVCRHYAPLTADVLTELGYEACNILVTQITSDIPLIQFVMHTLPNHVIVGVYEDGQKYTYDPTWECLGTKDESISDYNRQKNNIVKTVEPNSKSYGFIRKPNFTANYSKEELQLKMHSSPLETITLEESIALKEKIQRIIDQHECDIAEFVADNRPSMIRTSNLYQELFPSSDRPIKKWLIRK